MADSILRLKVQSEEYDSKLKRAAEGLTRYAEQCRKAGGTLQYVDDGVLEFTRSLGKMDTVATTTRGKLAELTKTYTELSAQYRKMTDEEKQGEYGKALAASLDQLRGRIQSSKQELDDINKSINGGGGLTSSLDNLAGKFGLSIKQLTGWGAAIAAAKGALDVAKDAFFQSESNIDEWGRTLEGAKGAYNVFLDTLNNGNWSNFFKNLETAIKGGRDLYDALDRLGSIKSNNAAAIAIVQQQIAQLRLAKQQGKDVDDQLKAATARLAALQKQSIQAGKAAGNQTAFNVIRNGVNSIGGARVNDATIRLAVDQLMTGGQAQFDKFRNNYQILQRKGTRTVVQELDDGMGGTVNKYRETFNINALTKEEQKQYAIAKAITEGETRIQVGISAFAQAVSEGTASAREEFRGNRYALQGAHGAGGSGGGTTTPVPVKIEGFDINAASTAGVRGVDTMPSVFGMADREAMRAAMGIGPQQYDAKQDVSKSWHIGQNGDLTQNPDDKYKEKTDKQVDVMAKLTTAIGGVSSIMSGLEQIGLEVPDEAKMVMNTIQGLMSIIQGVQAVISIFSTTSENANTAATIANTVALGALTTAMSVNTATNFIPFFAKGGVVHAANGFVDGRTFSGDQIPAMLNAGELVLNKSQQSTLATQLQSSGMGNMQLEAIVSGEALRFVLNSNGRRTGRGEIVTTNFR